MELIVVSPERVLYRGEAQSVTVPGAKGAFEVLENHAPIISILAPGKLAYKAAQTVEMDIKGGFIEVANNKASICIEV